MIIRIGITPATETEKSSFRLIAGDVDQFRKSAGGFI